MVVTSTALFYISDTVYRLVWLFFYFEYLGSFQFFKTINGRITKIFLLATL